MTLTVLFVANTEKMRNKKNSKILLILFTSDFYKYYYALNLASTYRAINKDVTLFYSGYAINFLLKKWKKYDIKKINSKIQKQKMPSYLEMINLCIELKIRFYFCKTAIDFVNINEKEFLDNLIIKSMALYQLVNKHKNDQTIFI